MGLALCSDSHSGQAFSLRVSQKTLQDKHIMLELLRPICTHTYLCLCVCMKYMMVLSLLLCLSPCLHVCECVSLSLSLSLSPSPAPSPSLRLGGSFRSSIFAGELQKGLQELGQAGHVSSSPTCGYFSQRPLNLARHVWLLQGLPSPEKCPYHFRDPCWS